MQVLYRKMGIFFCKIDKVKNYGGHNINLLYPIHGNHGVHNINLLYPNNVIRKCVIKGLYCTIINI